MAMTAAVSGTALVGEAGNPEITIPLNFTTPTITRKVGGIKKVIPQATSNQAVSFEGITSASFISIKARNSSTGTPQNISVRLNGTITLPSLTDYIHSVGQAAPGTAITSLEITTQAAAGDTTVDITIAGV